ncbi:hypothetical protein GLW08_07705 [Pontibacillus yanchengensis]|uniref:Uncharacterized protein n=2 Tax=Pontibacillus yanchengensis TaxID=462910 RepID=A0ACC7VEL6_9BACI|nr:YtpI family protein [Pontibacillus yanchengensis]MYL34130.1 hypothetical protein [Pontibacillus yanchengensis]MYL53223.1 hypothetical protein [Pontibacillus yanchengensis]
MVIFPIIIVLSATLYLYFKVSILRQNDPLYQEYTNSKARIALGTLLIAFAINQYAFYQTKIALYICLVLLVLGIMQLVYGVKTTKFYGKQINERADSSA